MSMLEAVADFIANFEKGVRLYISDVLVRLRRFTTRVYRALRLFMRRAEDYLVERIIDLLRIGWDLSRVMAFYVVGMAPFLALAGIYREPYWLVGALFWALLLTAKGFSYMRATKASRQAQDTDLTKDTKDKGVRTIVRIVLRALAILSIVAMGFVLYYLYQEQLQRQRDREAEEQAAIRLERELSVKVEQEKRLALQRIEEERKRAEEEMKRAIVAEARKLTGESLEQLMPILVDVAKYYAKEGSFPSSQDWIDSVPRNYVSANLFEIVDISGSGQILLEFKTENSCLAGQRLRIRPRGSFSTRYPTFRWLCLVLGEENQVDPECLPRYWEKTSDFPNPSRRGSAYYPRNGSAALSCGAKG